SKLLCIVEEEKDDVELLNKVERVLSNVDKMLINKDDDSAYDSVADNDYVFSQNFVPLKACVRTSNIPKQTHTDDIEDILNLENGSVHSNDSGVGVSAINNTRSLCNVRCCKCAVSSSKVDLVPKCSI